MVDKGMFSDREKAIEANYFRQQDQRLLDKLRQNATLDEIALAMRDKLQLDNPELLQRVRALGLGPDNAAAILVAPLVQVAWASDSVSKGEREAVFRLARERGVEDGSAAQAQLGSWLDQRPNDELFAVALDVIKQGLAVLSRVEREERIKQIVEACHEVAEVTGSRISWVLGIFDGINSAEFSALDAINKALRRP